MSQTTNAKSTRCNACYTLILFLILVNVIILDIFFFLKDKCSFGDYGVYRTMISPDGKTIGTPLNVSEISSRQACNLALISLSFYNGYNSPCCFDLGAQSEIVKNACFMYQIRENLDLRQLGWNVCEWEGVYCRSLEIKGM